MLRQYLGNTIKRIPFIRVQTALVVVLAMLVSSPAKADWKQECAKDIDRAMTNLTIVWKHLNAKRQMIDAGPQYMLQLKDSERCTPIWRDRLRSFQEDGSFVWWSRSAVLICEAGQRMSARNVARAKDAEVLAFWRRRLWRYGHCIVAGQRILMGMEG